jgi:cell division cycle protein 20 (cofactor of APC complex)
MYTAADESLKFWKIFEKKPGAGVGIGSAAAAAALAKADTPKPMTIR